MLQLRDPRDCVLRWNENFPMLSSSMCPVRRYDFGKVSIICCRWFAKPQFTDLIVSSIFCGVRAVKFNVEWQVCRVQDLPDSAKLIGSHISWDENESGGICSNYFKYLRAVIILRYFIGIMAVSVKVGACRADGHFSPTFKSLPRNWCWASKRGGYISRHISAPLGCVKWGQLEPCTFFSSPMVAASLWLTVVPESCYLSSFFPALSSSCMRTTPQFEMTNLVCGPSNRLVWTGRYYIIYIRALDDV